MKTAVKKTLRAELRKVRDRLSFSYRKRASSRITSKVLRLAEWRRARSVGLYATHGSEVDVRKLIRGAVAEGKTVALPKVGRNSMAFHQVRRGLADCRKGKYGILEPRASCRKVPGNKIDLLIVPGIAFDRKGHRLGYGRGFYDRFLAKNKPFTVGLAYRKTLVSHIPRYAHDARVRRVITEMV